MANNLYTNSVFVDQAALTHTKMNTMDSNIDAGLTNLSGALAAVAGDDRVLDDKDISTELYVTASAPADMNVNIATGYACVSEMIVRNESAAVLTIVAPAVSNRYDICQISNEGVLSTKSSAEQAVPVEPSADANNLKLAAIYLPQNTTKVEQSAGAFGHLIDRRVYSLHPVTVTRHMSRFVPGTLDTSMGSNSDGYIWGTSASGSTFNDAITINTVGLNVQDIPTGANVVATFHNITQVTSDTATLTAGSAFEEDATIDLDFAVADEMAIQISTVGSTLPGGWLDLDIQFVLQ